MVENDKPIKSNKLQTDESSTVAPAYKEQPKMQGKSSSNLPDDLAEVMGVWPELPEHIKAAIKALVETHKRKET